MTRSRLSSTAFGALAEGFDDPGYYGQRFAASFVPQAAVPGRSHPTGFGDSAVRLHNGAYWIALSGVSSWVDCFAADWAMLQARFAGARVVATVTLA